MFANLPIEHMIEYLHETDENEQSGLQTIFAGIQYCNFFLRIFQMLYVSFFTGLYRNCYYTITRYKSKYILIRDENLLAN